MDDDELLHWMQVGYDNSDKIREAIHANRPETPDNAPPLRDAIVIDSTALPHVLVPGGFMPGHCKCGYPPEASCHTDRAIEK